MVYRKKKKKYDNRTHGHGSSDKPRGGGNRGGRGRAGLGKKAQHKKFSLLKERFLKKKRVRKKFKSISLFEIDQKIDFFVKRGFAKKEKGQYIFYASKASYEKILGNGPINKKIEIHAKKFSENAKLRLREKGLKFVEL